MILAAGLTANSQAVPFINLGFERANIILDQSSPYFPHAINASNAVPGWTVTGSVTDPDVFYNDVSLGASAVSLQGPGSHEPILEGSYTVYLQGSSASSPSSAGIGQTGQIPANAESLQFLGAQVINFQVSFNGQSLPFSATGTGPNYTVYGADISPYAGQTGLLLFTALPFGGALLDNIQFSPNPIPEPSSLLLLVSGTGLLALSRKMLPA